MPLEAASYISQLQPTFPDGLDSKSEGDNHIRLLKVVLQNCFPGLAGRFGRIQEKTSSYDLVAGDNYSIIAFTGGTSILLRTASAASALGNGYTALVLNISGSPITFDPVGSELVNGASSVIIPTDYTLFIWCTGVGYFSALIPMNAPSSVPTGVVLPYCGVVAPSGYVLGSGPKTLGNAGSGATERANVDTENLYTLLWGWGDTVLPIQDSGGNASARGASAATDFGALKRLQLPDLQNRTIAFKGDLSGTSSDRLTAAIAGFNGNTLGVAGGDQRMQQHLHNNSISDPTHAHPFSDQTPLVDQGQGPSLGSGGNRGGIVASGTGAAATGISISNANAGAGIAQNVQPTIILSGIIKL